MGNIGAVSTDDETTEGYYLVEFSSEVSTGQNQSGTLLCDGYWLESIPGTRKWFTRSEISTTVHCSNVVCAKIEMLPVSPSNMLSAR